MTPLDDDSASDQLVSFGESFDHQEDADGDGDGIGVSLDARRMLARIATVRKVEAEFLRPKRGEPVKDLAKYGESSDGDEEGEYDEDAEWTWAEWEIRAEREWIAGEDHGRPKREGGGWREKETQW
jgi:hypothetical protein